MNIQQIEELEFDYATPADWDNAEARELGELHPDQAWVLTDRDVWHKNPNYKGPEEPYPEDVHYWIDEYLEAPDHPVFDYDIRCLAEGIYDYS